MKDIFGQALFDYFKGEGGHKLWINNTYGCKEEMPLDIYFRTEEEMPELELIALNNCRGKVLDIGAGAGSHALILQDKGLDVNALDISDLAVTIMLQRGVKHAIAADIFTYQQGEYDTLLLMMNGIGLCGTIQQLRLFLQHTKTLLNKGGQLLFDSSDIAYLYEGDLPDSLDYYGELSYKYAYQSHKTDWFKWLYIDAEKLKIIAAEEGWAAEVLYEDDMDQYLARLTPVN
ncbi:MULTISPECIES: methyltransferase domain-containing protein [unclassified Mucilaginibacter]|uniref:class I SAM-dependent methyltransferase n=1 Tax=unclassified Mucilaginibacter TaxID=2617802 RepID=UPI002AC934FE|nr:MULTISPECIES: methyltransferase domain-containing protein [unclassified Mucilaginibacter]MEB0262485.1 methyltransferase domain-containing protein [Mucilaginibacter sp. 10I4]MEB0279925.1 methyltransferase domain-containing protein [Mucilaginibacter sp. 10B2]MEB0300071.1 methyltransferase domain-containing protein [Mucilaginibacter sp. 5C4]WPX21883.1 methyltransferase domain-containing protein [Mucilaginibacter sp. 5C4]